MILHYSCPSCGAEMIYDIKKGRLHCSHCDKEMELSQAVWGESEAVSAGASGPAAADGEMPGGDNDIFAGAEYHCPNCGGLMVTKDKETSATCAYCGAPMILADRLTGKRRPVKILPFRIDRDEAEKAFRKWCKNGRFAPKGFTSAQNIQRLKGMYIPYWLFQFDTRVDVSAKATNVRVYRQGDYQITETEFYNVQRAYELQYENIPLDASRQLEDGEMAKLEPFNFNELKTFYMPYLAGFDSSSYDFDDKELSPTAKNKVRDYVKDYARGAVSVYTTVNLESQVVNFNWEEEEFIFVPIWFVDYNYRGKVYKFMMNGQNGRIAGTPPTSMKKVGLWWVGISAVLFIISIIGSLI